MTTFALVHGAWHGSWCWERLSPELEALGHQALAVDLPCAEVGAGCTTYAEVVTRALQDVEDEVVVVGHSLGGLTIPLVAATRPVRNLVFLCALLPRPGLSLIDQLEADEAPFAEGFAGEVERDELERSYWPPGTAAGGLYPDCHEDASEDACQDAREEACEGDRDAAQDCRQATSVVASPRRTRVRPRGGVA